MKRNYLNLPPRARIHVFLLSLSLALSLFNIPPFVKTEYGLKICLRWYIQGIIFSSYKTEMEIFLK